MNSIGYDTVRLKNSDSGKRSSSMAWSVVLSFAHLLPTGSRAAIFFFLRFLSRTTDLTKDL